MSEPKKLAIAVLVDALMEKHEAEVAALKAETERLMFLLNEAYLLNERLRSQFANGEWQPIETAPKDGTDVLAISNYGDGVHHAEVTAFCDGRWVVSNDDDGYAMQFRPSYWIPLPKPPCV